MPIFTPRRTLANWNFFRADDRLLLIVIALMVGICSGLAALALNRSLAAVLTWLHPYRGQVWAFVLPGVGAALSSLFLNKVVNEGAGHGVPEVVYAVSRHGGLLRFRSSYSRLISSFLTIGSGGSAGPEAPVVMSGAAIGSNIAKYFSLNDRQRTTLVGCGAAGAIASIFNAPIAGMVFAVEVILGEWSARNIIPIAMAAVAGTEVSRILQGNQIAFEYRHFDIHLVDIAASAGLAVAAALASVLLTRALRATHRLSGRLVVPAWVRAALGGCLVGLIGLRLPVVLGEGYHAIDEMIGGHFASGLLIAAAAALAKVLATALTLGSGGSGGIFAPSLVIGSLVGLVYHRALIWIWPAIGLVNEGCFALLGMAGLISGMLQAPLTGIFLIVELTGGYETILPLIIVSTIATTLSHYFEPASYYLRDLVERGQLLRPGTDRRVLTDMSVREMLETDCVGVAPEMRLREFIEVVKRSRRNYFPVSDPRSGIFLGIVYLDDIRPYLFDPLLYDAVVVGQFMHAEVQVASPDDDLHEVLRRMDTERRFSMPVVFNGRFLGMISKATLLDRYRRELMVQTHWR
jgi:CIC family chloride channel protein